MADNFLASKTLLTVQEAGSTPTIKPTADIDKAREQAEDFEAVFLSQMIEPMFKGLGTDGMFGGGNGEEVFRSMMIQEFGKVMAKAGGVGLADEVMKHILTIQEQNGGK